MKVYARRVNTVETDHETAIPSFKDKKLICLSGDGRTSPQNGLITPGESRIAIVSGFVAQSYFHIPPPEIAVDYLPIRYVFLKTRRPLVLATALSNPSVTITARLE